MTRIALTLYLDPCSAEVFATLKNLDGSTRRLAVMVDTGAETSFYPLELLDEIEHRITWEGRITVEQAGVSGKTHEVLEAVVPMALKDLSGSKTKEFEARVRFAETTTALLGFTDILDRATLYLDYRKQREGWLEID